MPKPRNQCLGVDELLRPELGKKSPGAAGQLDDIEPRRPEDARGTSERIRDDVTAAVRIEISGILALDEIRLSRVEQIERPGTRHRGKLRHEVAQNGWREVLYHLDADAGVECPIHAVQRSDDVVRIAGAVRRGRRIGLDRMKPIDHLWQECLKCIEQPTGAGADIDERADRQTTIRDRLRDAQHRRAETALPRRVQLIPPVVVGIDDSAGNQEVGVREKRTARATAEIPNAIHVAIALCRIRLANRAAHQPCRRRNRPNAARLVSDT